MHHRIRVHRVYRFFTVCMPHTNFWMLKKGNCDEIVVDFHCSDFRNFFFHPINLHYRNFKNLKAKKGNFYQNNSIPCAWDTNFFCFKRPSVSHKDSTMRLPLYDPMPIDIKIQTIIMDVWSQLTLTLEIFHIFPVSFKQLFAMIRIKKELIWQLFKMNK